MRWLEGATSGLAQDLDGVLSFAAGHQQRASELQHELELSQADALAAGRRVADLESELTAALDRTAGAEARTEQVTARVLELERELESARDAHENKLRELRLRLVRAEVRPSQPATSTEANVQRLADHEQVGELQAELARAKLQAAQTAARMASLERELEQAAKTYERELVGLRTRLETRASQLESQLGRERVTHEAQLQGLQAQLADARQRASTSFGRIHHLEQRLTAAATSSAALKVAVETLRSDASKSRTQAIELERELKQERETRQVQMQELQSALEAERIKAAAARADLEAALQELAGGPMLAAAASGSGTPVAASARRPEKVRAGQSPDMLDGLRQAAETRARRHAEADVQAAVLALPRRQAEVRRIAELPALERQQRAAREHRAVRGQPGRAAAQETALALAQATLAPVTRSAQQISPRPRRIERSRSSWLLLAFVLGLFVLVAGVMLTVLILAGAV